MPRLVNGERKITNPRPENVSRDYDEEGMSLFEESVKKYMPEDEETNDYGILSVFFAGIKGNADFVYI